MEEMFLKIGEFGALGIISVYLLTKGTSALKDLSDSNKQLADAVTKLSDKVSSLDTRVVTFEYELRSISTRLEKIESTLAGLVKVPFAKD